MKFVIFYEGIMEKEESETNNISEVIAKPDHFSRILPGIWKEQLTTQTLSKVYHS